MSAHMPRIITGLVLIAILGLCLYFGGLSLYALAFLVSGFGMWEFYSMFWPGREKMALKLTGIFMCGILLLATYVHIEAIPLALSLNFLLGACIFLCRYGFGDESTRDIKLVHESCLLLVGVLYVPLAMSLTLLLSLPEQLLLFGVVAAADTCAYFVGIYFGKHKIWVAVSPKKSLEGCFGGIIGCVLVCLIFGLIFEDNISNLPGYAALGVALAIGSMLGDFFESALKRLQKVKDSGVILPGHGGVLDRIDSFLFVVPVYFIIKSLA